MKNKNRTPLANSQARSTAERTLKPAGYKIVRRGEIYIADLGRNAGSEQSGIRPVVIIQNNCGNYFAPTTIIAPITIKSPNKDYLPVHVRIGNCGYCLEDDSKVLLEQIRTIDKRKLSRYICTLTAD
jgi:mRNA interferase MazF